MLEAIRGERGLPHLALARLLTSALMKRWRNVRALLADMHVPFTAASVVQL